MHPIIIWSTTSASTGQFFSLVLGEWTPIFFHRRPPNSNLFYDCGLRVPRRMVWLPRTIPNRTDPKSEPKRHSGHVVHPSLEGRRRRRIVIRRLLSHASTNGSSWAYGDRD